MGQPQVQRVSFADPMRMQFEVSRRLQDGYQVMSQTPTGVTLVKHKKFSVGWMLTWLVVGIFSALIPLVIYFIVYACASDQILQFTLDGEAADVVPLPPRPVETTPPAGTAPHVQDHQFVRTSEDGSMWWDGQDWVDAARTAPPDAPRSDDGSSWWDGKGWHPVPAGPGA
jgi:hypothetical protein